MRGKTKREPSSLTMGFLIYAGMMVTVAVLGWSGARMASANAQSVFESEIESRARNCGDYLAVCEAVVKAGGKDKLDQGARLFTYLDLADAYHKGWRARAAWAQEHGVER